MEKIQQENQNNKLQKKIQFEKKLKNVEKVFQT